MRKLLNNIGNGVLFRGVSKRDSPTERRWRPFPAGEWRTIPAHSPFRRGSHDRTEKRTIHVAETGQVPFALDATAIVLDAAGESPYNTTRFNPRHSAHHNVRFHSWTGKGRFCAPDFRKVVMDGQVQDGHAKDTMTPPLHPDPEGRLHVLP